MEIRIGNRWPGNTPARRLSRARDGESPHAPSDFELPAATALGVIPVLLGLLLCGAMASGFSGGLDLLKRLLIGGLVAVTCQLSWLFAWSFEAGSIIGLVAAVAVLPTLRPLDLANSPAISTRRRRPCWPDALGFRRMDPARDVPADAPASVPLSTTLARMAASEAALSTLTGGASAADVLAELAQLAAAELAQHFERLPNPAMDGVLPRIPGWRGWLQRPPTVRHRVVLVRYTSADPTWASSVGPSLVSIDVAGHVLAIGDDGMLRVGPFEETLLLDVGTEVPVDPVPYTDPRTRRVPTDRVRLTPWTGANTPEQVAPPEVVLEALRVSATQLQAQLDGQAALLRRLLTPS